MKKMRVLAVMLGVALALGLALAGCGDGAGGGDGNHDSALVGVWARGSGSTRYEFKSNGDLLKSDEYRTSEKIATWSTGNNILTCRIPDSSTGGHATYAIAGTSLTIVAASGDFEYFMYEGTYIKQYGDSGSGDGTDGSGGSGGASGGAGGEGVGSGGGSTGPETDPAGFTYTTNAGNITITGYTETLPSYVVIPATIEGKPVTAIGDDAFSYCSLYSVTIPNSVTSIGRVGFNACGSLTSVTIPDSVTSIGYAAFLNCTSLTSVNVQRATAPLTTLGTGYWDAFNSSPASIVIYVPAGVVDDYKGMDGWKVYAARIQPAP